MSWVRRELPLIIAFLTGFIIIADYIVKIPVINDYANLSINWAVILAAFAFILGGLNSIKREARTIYVRRKYWINSVVMLVFLFLTLGIGLVYTINSPYYSILFINMLSPLTLTMAGFMGYFMASSAFRVFRARNFESGLLLVAAIFVMLKNAPIGAMIWPGFPVIGDWFISVFGTGGNRGIAIGSAIAGVFFGLRILLGYERRWTGGSE